jgi:hypothetical protein
VTSMRSSLAVAVVLATVLLPCTVHAAELTPTEKLYADLFKLPLAEREARILEGAKKEAAFGVHPNYRRKARLSIFETQPTDHQGREK